MQDWSDDAFAGYLAAMIDGEGNIEIISNYSVRIRIANTEDATLRAMHSRLGFGRIEEYKRPSPRLKRLYCLTVSNCRDLRQLFYICGSFIHMKKEKAQEALVIIDRVLKESELLDCRNRAILDEIAKGDKKQKDIAAAYGVSPQLVSMLKNGHTWASTIARHRSRALLKKFPKGADQTTRLHGLDRPSH